MANSSLRGWTKLCESTFNNSNFEIFFVLIATGSVLGIALGRGFSKTMLSDDDDDRPELVKGKVVEDVLVVVVVNAWVVVVRVISVLNTTSTNAIIVAVAYIDPVAIDGNSGIVFRLLCFWTTG